MLSVYPGYTLQSLRNLTPLQFYGLLDEVEFVLKMTNPWIGDSDASEHPEHQKPPWHNPNYVDDPNDIHHGSS